MSSENVDRQLSLFSAHEHQQLQRYQVSETHTMSAGALQTWLQRVYRFQQEVRYATAPHQAHLLDSNLSPDLQNGMPEKSYLDPYKINPFKLTKQNIEFWRWRPEDLGMEAFYFVIDSGWPILLYVGETIKSNQRWKGVHDCKRYVKNYVNAHHQHGLNPTINIGFLLGAPSERRPRQQLERRLIERWRSPFNKENWQFWGTPFTQGK